VLDRVDVLRARLTHSAFERGHERGGLAAHERARALDDRDVEVHARAEDVVAEQAVGARLLDGFQQTLAGDRVLVSDVDEAVRAPIAFAR